MLCDYSKFGCDREAVFEVDPFDEWPRYVCDSKAHHIGPRLWTVKARLDGALLHPLNLKEG